MKWTLELVDLLITKPLKFDMSALVNRYKYTDTKCTLRYECTVKTGFEIYDLQFVCLLHID